MKSTLSRSCRCCDTRASKEGKTSVFTQLRSVNYYYCQLYIYYIYNNAIIITGSLNNDEILFHSNIK